MSRIPTGTRDFSDESTVNDGDIRGLAHAYIEDFPEHMFREVFVRYDPDDGDDGRSQVVQIRFPNGDLFLGFAPQGEVYMELEEYYL